MNDKINPMGYNNNYLNGVSGGNTAGYNLDNRLASILGRVQSLGTNPSDPNAINMLQAPQWNIYDPQQVYKHTGGLGNCTVLKSFGNVTLRLPAWHYANEDNEWGTTAVENGAGNVTYTDPSGVSSGTGVLTPETFQGKHKSHKLYQDLATGNYFYVVRHGHHDPTTGLESEARQKLPATIPNRLFEDAEIGSDDKWSKKYDPTFENTCIVGVPNPHLSKADFMRLIYPSYDDPMQRALALTSNPSTFLNEPVDDTKYTPYQDLSSVVSAANLDSATSKEISSNFSQSQSEKTKTIGRDRQPLDPNFHVFRPVNTLAIQTHPDMAAADIIGLSGGKYGHLQAWKLIEAYVNNGTNYSCGVGGGLSANQYYSILNSISPYRNLPSKNDPDYDKFVDSQGNPVDLVALSIATGKSSFASTPLTKLNSLAPYQENLAGYMFSRQYRYEALLFDYYADNSKFFSGTFDVTGRLGIEYGIRLLWYDKRRQYVWEFYVDGVGQSWSVNGNGTPSPWVTTISVERGLPFTLAEIHEKYRDPANGKPYHYTYDVPTIMGTMDNRKGKTIEGNFSKRFTGGFWGRQAIFTGGFFGEQTLASMVAQANLRNKAFMSHFGSNSTQSSKPSKSSAKSTGSSDIVSFAKKYIGLPYALGGDSHDIEEGKPKSQCSGTDCNKFAWAVVTHCGYEGGPYPGDCDDSINNLSKYEVPESKTHSGSLIICEAHAMIMEEKGHGDSTKIINETKGAAGNHVMETTVGPEMEGVSRANWHYFNLPKK